MKKIVILHGWTYSLDKWENVVKLLRDFGFSVELLKVPGLTNESIEVWDLNKYVEWLHKELTKIKDKVILIGHSNGGRISIAYAAKYPEGIEHLVLIDSAGIYHNGLPIRVKRLVFNTFAKVGKRVTKSSILRRLLYKLAREGDYEKANENMRKTMINLLRVDFKPYLEKINVPTQIIWGEEDKITPVSDAFVMKKYIKGSKLEIIKEAGHSPFYSNPKEVAEIIKR